MKIRVKLEELTLGDDESNFKRNVIKVIKAHFQAEGIDVAEDDLEELSRCLSLGKEKGGVSYG